MGLERKLKRARAKGEYVAFRKAWRRLAEEQPEKVADRRMLTFSEWTSVVRTTTPSRLPKDAPVPELVPSDEESFEW